MPLATFGSATNVPAPLPAHEVALAHELVERGAHGQAGDAEVDAELPLGRDRRADRERLDQLEDALTRLALLRQRAAASAAAPSVASRAPVSGSKKWKRARIDGQIDRIADAGGRLRVDPGREERPSVGQAAAGRRLENLSADRGCVDMEEDVDVGAELLEHLDPRPESSAARARTLRPRTPRGGSRARRARRPRRAAGRRRTARGTGRSARRSSSSVASTRFIAGEPMNAAMKRFVGRS